MFIDHNSYSIPESIAGVRIKSLSWQLFKGTPPPNSQYSAHIYWGINYHFAPFGQGTQPPLTVAVNVRPKSWRVKEDIKLLQH